MLRILLLFIAVNDTAVQSWLLRILLLFRAAKDTAVIYSC